MSDHVHMLIAIPPKYAVSQVIGFIKGKSAIHLAGIRRAQTQLRGATLLGARVFRLDCGPGRGTDSDLHPKSGQRRQSLGSVAT
jgi:transposase IS200 family protein